MSAGCCPLPVGPGCVLAAEGGSDAPVSNKIEEKTAVFLKYSCEARISRSRFARISTRRRDCQRPLCFLFWWRIASQISCQKGSAGVRPLCEFPSCEARVSSRQGGREIDAAASTPWVRPSGRCPRHRRGRNSPCAQARTQHLYKERKAFVCPKSQWYSPAAPSAPG